MPKHLIVLTDLAKKFGHKAAVDKISMSIGQGEVFGFLGANGAGKTTTIRMLCGLTKPTAGRATIDGLDVWRDRFRIRSKFGYVSQRFSLYGDLTVGLVVLCAQLILTVATFLAYCAWTAALFDDRAHRLFEAASNAAMTREKQ